jgi:CheY-like chemotaxis protein
MGDEMAYIALRHPKDDVRQLIEHALLRLGHVTVPEHEEHHAHVLVVEPASEPDLEAAQRLREAHPDLPIVCISILPAFDEALELEPAAYLVKPFTIAGLRSTVEGVLGKELRGLQAI